MLVFAFLPSVNPEVNGKKLKCDNIKWGSKDHDDNNPSTKKGWKMIKSGANVCELAKACDHMEIKVRIDDAKEMHKYDFYKEASHHIQEELDEYAEHGSGHDNPNMVCYEIIDAVSGD